MSNGLVILKANLLYKYNNIVTYSNFIQNFQVNEKS